MRIASLSPAATEILFALGKGRGIVCVDQFSDFPEEAKKLPARIRMIDDSLLDRPGPRLLEGAQRLYGWMFELTH